MVARQTTPADRIDPDPRPLILCVDDERATLDLRLPKVDGLEVLRRLKADDRAKKIPVVILTSSKEEKDIVESYARCVNSYLVKPVGFEQFVDAIKQFGLCWLLVNRVSNS
jgi:DNA-binding response OmpR family regulator